MKRFLSILSASIIFLNLTPFALAQGIDLGEEFQLDPTTQTSVRDRFPSITNLLSAILPNLYIIAGLILFFILLFGGFTLVTSGGSPEKTQKGQQAITGAIIGFVIIFASYWIIQIIEIITGINILNNTII